MQKMTEQSKTITIGASYFNNNDKNLKEDSHCTGLENTYLESS